MHMTIAELRDFLNTAPDDALVVVSGHDHTFLPADASLEDAMLSTSELGDTLIYEDYGPDAQLHEDDSSVKVLWFR